MQYFEPITATRDALLQGEHLLLLVLVVIHLGTLRQLPIARLGGKGKKHPERRDCHASRTGTTHVAFPRTKGREGPFLALMPGPAGAERAPWGPQEESSSRRSLAQGSPQELGWPKNWELPTCRAKEHPEEALTESLS